MDPSDRDLVASIPPPRLRKLLNHTVQAALEEWDSASLLPRPRSTDRFIHLALHVQEQVAKDIESATKHRSQVNAECWRWKDVASFGDVVTVTNLRLENDQSREADQRILQQNDTQGRVLATGANYCDDQHLLLRLWLPDLDHHDEAILLVMFDIFGAVLTPEIGQLLEDSYEIVLSGIRRARHLSEISAFLTATSRTAPDWGVAEASERLLYHEMWRLHRNACRQEPGGTLDLINWLDPDAPAVVLETPDQDYVVASYLASLMYLMNQGDDAAARRLMETLQTTERDKGAVVRVSRGPAIEVGPGMVRARLAIAQACAQLLQSRGLSGEEQKELEQRRDRLVEDLEVNIASTGPQEMRRLKTMCSIAEFDAGRFLPNAPPPGDGDAEAIVEEANEIAWRMQPLLRATLCNLIELQPGLSAGYGEKPPPGGSDAPAAFSAGRPCPSAGLADPDQYIDLSARWLDAWFGLRLIDSEVLPKAGDLKTHDPLRVAEIVKCWACYVRYLLDYFVLRHLGCDGDQELPDLPTEPASDAVEQAKLTLICEWAHCLGVPRTIPLHAWLWKTRESELALYSLSGKGHYRQHLFHVQDECLLGCALLFSRWGEPGNGQDDTLLSILARVSGVDKDQMLCNWFVAALLHDLGMALQVIPRGLEALPEGTAKGLHELVAAIHQCISQASHEVADYDPTPTRAGGKMKTSDHGHVSMTTALSHLGCLNDGWQTADAYTMAAAAIVEHNSKDTPIDYASDPLSALIVVCDQLQDWARPRLDASLLASNVLATIYVAPGEHPKPVDVVSLFASSRLYVKVAGLDDNRCNLIHPVRNGTRSMQFLVYGPRAGAGGYEPAVAWLDVCRAFQRIRPSTGTELPLIHVVLQHGVAQDGLSELRRLARFAQDAPEQRGTILDWLHQARLEQLVTHRPKMIEYHCGDRPHTVFSVELQPDVRHDLYEWIEYAIPDLSNDKDPLLKGLPDGLYKAYREFRDKQAGKRG